MVTTIVVGVLEANCHIVWDDETLDAIIIDPGDDGAKIASYMDKYGIKPRMIINTHFHFDHTGANKYLKEKYAIPICIGKADAPFLPKAYLHAQQFMIRSQPSPPADRLLFDGECLQVGSIDFVVLETPGHSPGSICLYDSKRKILFSGDTLFYESVGRWDLPGGDELQLRRSLQRLARLPEETLVYTGHGIETTIKHEKTNNPFLTGEL